MGCLAVIIIILLIGGLIIEILPWVIGFSIFGIIIAIFAAYGKKALEEEDVANREKELKELYNEIQSYGLPSVETTVMLSPREKCHYQGSIDRLVTSRRVTRYEGQSSGYSFRLAKGFTVRQGSNRGVPIREDVIDRYQGTLVITNKRIVFLGEKGFEFTYGDITALEDYSNAIDIQVGKNRYIISSLEIEKIQLILGTILALKEESY